MRLFELGARIRAAREARGISQAALADAAGVSRVTISQLEGGWLRDLGYAKVEAIARCVGLTLAAIARPTREPDLLAMAATTASVGFRTKLSTQELVEALMKGQAPPARRPHLRRLFEDSPAEFVRRFLVQMNRLGPPGRVHRGLERLAVKLNLPSDRVNEWMKAV
jgi:transcriptional regulator with XRE-family HTH domain